MTRFSFSGWRTLTGIILSAVLFGLYSRGSVAYLLGFVALVPWLLSLNSITSAWRAIGSGVLMSALFSIAVFAWFGVAIGTYTGMGAWLGLLAMVIAAPLLQPQFIVFALLRYFARKRYRFVMSALVSASAWVATETLMPRLLGDTLGHGLYPSETLRQAADLGGAAGLTFLLIIINECVAHAITQHKQSKRRLIAPIVLGACIIATMIAYGLDRAPQFTQASTTDSNPLRVGMVQSNIVDYERLRREMGAYPFVHHVLNTHFTLSKQAVDQHQVDALLWSETIYPTTFSKPKSDDGAQFDQDIFNFIDAMKVPLVFGTYDRDEQSEYNAAAFIEPNSSLLGFYRKTNLFLFTEYVPVWLDEPLIRKLLPWTGNWKAGDGARVFPLRLRDGREIPVFAMICLDDVDPQLAIDNARLGGQVILSMSNDSWFTQYPIGAELHRNVAAFRSIETRLPQARVTANGISSVIDPSGNVIASTRIGEQALLVGKIYPREAQNTLMMMWGDWVGRAALWFLIAAGLFALVQQWSARLYQKALSKEIAAAQRYRTKAVLISPTWRLALSALRLCSWAGLLYVGYITLFSDIGTVNPLKQIRWFAVLVAAPHLAIWLMQRALSATVSIENSQLIIEQSHRRIEISINDISSVAVWRLSLPFSGAHLKLRSGKWQQDLGLIDTNIFTRALSNAGYSKLTDSPTGFAERYTQIRASAAPSRWNHWLLKFVLFPLLLALPAFRLHQIIAYGSTFGEYHTFGLKPYLIALAIWWASWIIGMTLFASALRVLVEIGTWLIVLFRTEQPTQTRHTLELLARLIYYIGLPVWLIIRFWPAS
jgi:apolipoprotein N-acyltransferase